MNNDYQPKSREEWYTIIDEQTSSGLTQTAFCKQHNLSHCKFSYYKQLRIQPQSKPSFTPVKVNTDVSTSTGMIKIDLPNGFCCHIPSSISVERLKSIIGALVSC